MALVICFGSNDESMVRAILAPIPETDNSLKSRSDFSINPKVYAHPLLFEDAYILYKICVGKQRIRV
jgi:hypothetical protein